MADTDYSNNADGLEFPGKPLDADYEATCKSNNNNYSSPPAETKQSFLWFLRFA